MRIVDHPRRGYRPARGVSVQRRSGGGPLAPWVLLGVVIVGVFCLHALTVDHGDHGDLPAAVVADVGAAQAGAAPAWVAPVVFAVDVFALSTWVTGDPVAPTGGDRGFLAGCILFLAVAGAVALLLLRSHRVGFFSGRAGAGGSVWWRGSPRMAHPRLALCVMRI